MKKRVKIAIVFSIIVIIACVAGFINAWIIIGGLKMSDLTEDAKQNTEKVDVRDILLTETKNGQKYWEIYAGSGNYQDNRSTILLKNVIGNFYDEKGKVILSFESDEGEYDSEFKKVILKKNAKLASIQDTQMEADKITWEGQNDMLYGEGHVNAIKDTRFLIQCDRTKFSTNFKDFYTYGNTKTKIYEGNY